MSNYLQPREWIALGQLCKLAGCDKKTVQKRAGANNAKYKYEKGQGGRRIVYKVETLPTEYQKLIVFDQKAIAEFPKISVDFWKLDSLQRNKAFARYYLISDFNAGNLGAPAFCEAYNNRELDICENGFVLKHVKKLSTPTFWRYRTRLEKHGMMGLVHEKVCKSIPGCKTLTDEHQDYLKQLYLNQRKYSIKKCYDELCKLYGDVASYMTVTRFLKALSPALVCLHRDGKKAYNDKFAPYIPRDYYKIRVMECWESDHHMLDLFVTDGTSVFRPWVTVFVDKRSRKIVGFCVSRYPSTRTILQALFMGLMLFGAPESVLFDNGKDYRSSHLQGKTIISDEYQIKLTGVLENFGITCTFAQPYHGQSKGIERSFRTLCERFSKTQETYCGSNTAERADVLKENWKEAKKMVTLTIKDIDKRIAGYFQNYNKNWNHSGHAMEGRTPDQVFRSGYRKYKKVDIPQNVLHDLISKPLPRKVGRNGVKIDGILYYSAEMAEYKGKKVIVRRSLGDFGKVKIFSLIEGKNKKFREGCFICWAKNDILADKGIVEDNMKRLKKAQKRERQILNESVKIQRNSHKTTEQRLIEDAAQNIEEKGQKSALPSNQSIKLKSFID